MRSKATPRRPRRAKHVPEGFAWPELGDNTREFVSIDDEPTATTKSPDAQPAPGRRARVVNLRRGAAICGCIALVGVAGMGLAGGLGVFDGSVDQPDPAPLGTPSVTPSAATDADDRTPTPSEHPSSTRVPSPSTTPSVFGAEDAGAATQVPLLPGTEQQWTIGSDRQSAWNLPGHSTVTQTPAGSSAAGTGATGGDGHTGTSGGSGNPKPSTGGQTGGQTGGGEGSGSGGSPSGEPSTGGGDEASTDPTTPGSEDGSGSGTDPTIPSDEIPSDPPPDPGDGQE